MRYGLTDYEETAVRDGIFWVWRRVHRGAIRRRTSALYDLL